MNWLQYLLEANLYLCLFYAAYYLLLSKETYYNLNRGYLLLTCTFAFAIPFLQLGFLNPVADTTIVTSYTVGSGAAGMQVAETSVLTWQSALLYLYITGAIAAFVLFGIKLYKLFRLIKKYPVLKHAGYSVIFIDETNTAFSFFNYLFIGKNTSGADTITSHELVHIRQKHSYDIIFTEMVKILNWFNPLVYLLQNSVKRVHEYIADEQTANLAEDKLAYSTFLLNNAYGLQGLSFSNSFFNYNLLKNRITMLNQQRSGKLAGLKYLLAIPLCSAMLCASTLSFSKNYGFVDLLPQNEIQPTADTTPVKRSKKIARQRPVVTDIKLTDNNKSGIKDTVYTEVILIPQKLFSNVPVKAPKAVKTKVQLLAPPDKNEKTPIVVQVISNFDGLLNYVSKHVLYPAVAVKNKTAGVITVTFAIDENGVIGNKMKTEGTLAEIFKGEVVRVVGNYKDKIATKPGTYKMFVQFVIKSSDDDSKIIRGTPPTPIKNEVYAGEVSIVAFTKF